MIKKILLGSLVAISSLAASAQDNAPESHFSPDTNRIKSHLYFLADDLLEGRDTGSRGHNIAALYIATEFAKYGLKPAGTEGFMQPVPFRKANLVQESPSFNFESESGSFSLSYPKDFITGPDLLSNPT